MNERASLGVILFFALLAGHLVKYIRVPEVTGYMLAGVAVGPSFLGWITHENLDSLKVFSEVALGLILFSIGSIFEWGRFREIGRRALTITVLESLLTGVLVGGCLIAAGQPWPVSLILASISMGTAAATTLMVIRECNAQGVLTETLTGIIAMDNILCLIAFSLVAAAIDLSGNAGGPQQNIWQLLYETVFPLVWQIVGSVALGYLIGVLLSVWASHVVEQGETLILMIGSVLLCVGIAQWLEVSPFIASLSVGATMVNLSGRSRALFQALSRTDPPLYAIFFVIAGADLNLALLPTLGILGAGYVLARSVGKFAGTQAAARFAGLNGETPSLLGFSMLSQAGLAIGLVLVTNQRFPEIRGVVATVVLSSVGIFELAGPLLARFALVRSGETRPQEKHAAVLLD